LNFLNLPLWGIGAGFTALAAGLFVLQMLRVRHRQIEVPTTMFWRQAVEQSRARVLRQRFRHPWAYLLSLVIAALLWFAIAGLVTSPHENQDYLLILDGSVGMSHSDRFESAVNLLLADAEGIPADGREVWWSGAQTQLLLAKGEHVLLLAERLTNLQPEAASSAIEQRLLQMALFANPQRSLQVRLYSDAPLQQAALDLLPGSVEVLRCTPLAPAQPGNHGWLAGGLSEAASGRWDCVDLLVEIFGSTEAPRVTANGSSFELAGTSTTTATGSIWLFVDVAARGQILELTLPVNDSYPADDKLVLALPHRRPLQVLVSPTLLSLFEPLIIADSGFILASDSPDLVLRQQGEALGLGLPALEMTRAPANGHAFEITYTAEGDPDQLLQQVHAALGLAEIDALALAQQLQQPISLGVTFGAVRNIQLWERLLDPEGGFTTSRSFPLFLGRALRWLANTESFPSVVQTGQPLAVANGDWVTPSGSNAVTANLPLRPTEAGLYSNRAGVLLAAAAFDRPASFGAAALPDAKPGVAINSLRIPLWSWLVLLALMLLGVEWVLFQNGRIP